MTAEIVGAALAFALGWLCLRPFASTTGFAFVATTAFPIGMAAWVVASAASLAALIPFHPITGGVLATGLAAIVNGHRRTRVTRHESSVFVGAGAILLTCTAIFARFEWVIFNTDAQWTLYMASDLVERGFFSDEIRKVQLGADPVYLSLVSAYARWMGEIYFVSLSPLMMVSCGALLAVLGIRAAASEPRITGFRLWAPVLGAVLLLTSGFFVNGTLQLKTHGVYAVHMLGACGALYFAGREGRADWLILALVFTAPLVICRFESGVSALPILVVAAAISTVSRRARLWGVGLVAVTWGLAYLYLLGATSYYFGGFERGLVSKKLVWIGAPPGIFGALLLFVALVEGRGGRDGVLEHLSDRFLAGLPALMIATLIAVLAGHILAWPDTFWSTLHGLFAVMATPDMGGLGYGTAVIALLVLSLAVNPRPPWVWTIGVPVAAFLIVLALADVHLDGFPHWGGGSLTRMVTHVMPTLLFYVLVRFVAPASRPSAVSAAAGPVSWP
jgi:hypothetical protein